MPEETTLDRFVTEYIFRGDTSALDRIADKAQQTSQKLAGMSAKLGIMGAAMTASTVGILAQGTQIEAGWSEVAAKTGKTTEEIRDTYESAAWNIAATTGVAMEDIQDSFQKAISANLQGAEAIEAVTLAAKGQAAGIGESAKTVSAATTLWTAFGTDVAESINVVTAAAQFGEGETEDFANAFKGIVGLAGPKALNISLQDTAAGLAAISQTALSVPVGKSRMESFLRKLLTPTEGLRDVLAEAGIEAESLRDIAANEGLATVLELLDEDVFQGDIDKIKKGLSDQFAIDFFLNVEPEMLRRLSGQVHGATAGAVDRAFAERETTLVHSFSLFTAQLARFSAVATQTLAPVIEKVTSVVVRLTEKLNSAPGPVRVLIALFLVAGPILLGLSAVVGILAGMYSAYAAVLRVVIAVSNLDIAVKIKQAIATRLASVAQWQLNAAMYANPIGLIIAGVALLIAGLILLERKTGLVTKTFKFMAGILEFVVLRPLKEVWKTIEWIAKNVGFITDSLRWIANAWNWLWKDTMDDARNEAIIDVQVNEPDPLEIGEALRDIEGDVKVDFATLVKGTGLLREQDVGSGPIALGSAISLFNARLKQQEESGETLLKSQRERIERLNLLFGQARIVEEEVVKDAQGRRRGTRQVERIAGHDLQTLESGEFTIENVSVDSVLAEAADVASDFLALPELVQGLVKQVGGQQNLTDAQRMRLFALTRTANERRYIAGLANTEAAEVDLGATGTVRVQPEDYVRRRYPVDPAETLTNVGLLGQSPATEGFVSVPPRFFTNLQRSVTDGLGNVTGDPGPPFVPRAPTEGFIFPPAGLFDTPQFAPDDGLFAPPDDLFGVTQTEPLQVSSLLPALDLPVAPPPPGIVNNVDESVYDNRVNNITIHSYGGSGTDQPDWIENLQDVLDNSPVTERG